MKRTLFFSLAGSLLVFINFSFALSKDELMGKISAHQHPDFVRFVSGGRVFSLRREAYAALAAMTEAAKKDGISLVVVSAFRSFDDQKRIWETKWKRFASSYPDPVKRCKAILRYSSAPGTSRHHWGTDVDLVSVDPAFFKTKEGQRILAWLETHAPSYGFERPYTPLSQRNGGYEEEPWHWSYRPLATNYLSLYTNTITQEDITGFSGDNALKEVDILSYILGISPTLLP
ncbi:MAG: M15 family metallopeptidase [Brevinematales bacterium]|nr:M15 family metallopeptidase [Brevinematales bacterium]